MSGISLSDVKGKTLAATRPTTPRDISGTVTLTKEEDSICTLLDEFTKVLRNSEDDFKGVECRIAGGWVRDKLLGIPSNDIDIALADIMGAAFAEKLQAYMVSNNLIDNSGSRSGTIATIARNPEQSKHLETARMHVLGHEVDFVNLRSETYAEDSRIPEIRIGTPLEDALRRDITINALFYNVHTRLVEDLTEKGLSDLREGIARTPLAPLQTFQDDPLRVLRCIRFSSRFGFEIEKEAGKAMHEQSIQDALVRKIKRERVGEEFLKMLKDKSPLLSLTSIEKYGIYDTVFGIPPDLVGKATGIRHSRSTGINAASILCNFFNSAPTTLPIPHYELLKQAHEDHGLRQRLIFAAALTPWRDMICPQKKGHQSAVELIVKEGLKIGSQNHFIPSVPKLFAAHKKSSNPSLEKFEGPSQRALIGLLLRDSDVHSPRTGTHWSSSLLFSLVQDLVDLIDDQNTLDDLEAQRVVQTYNEFVDRVLELDLVKSIEEPPRLNGKEISTVLGIKPGKEIGMYMEHVVRWQLEHPDESIDACKVWLKDLHQSSINGGSGLAAQAPKRARRVRLGTEVAYYVCEVRGNRACYSQLVTTGIFAVKLARTELLFRLGRFVDPLHCTRHHPMRDYKVNLKAANSPDPVAPYTLQVLTSNYVVPFYINAGSSLSYDFTVPFALGTQYQICMYDSNGQTGGCQATYTVIPATGTPSCANMTFPQTLDVDAKSSTGPLSQYGLVFSLPGFLVFQTKSDMQHHAYVRWPNQCTDISLTPKSGTPPFTFTVAPALHPPVNITSNSMAPINWTIDLSWGSPFFVTLADSSGRMWSYGPLHSGGNGVDTCLSGSNSSVPLGATVGAVIGAFVIGGVLASLLFFFVSRKRHNGGAMGGRPSLTSLDLREPSARGQELRPTPYITSPTGSRALYSPLGTREESYSTMNSGRPLMRTGSRSSFGREPAGLATTGLQAEPFNPAGAPTAAASVIHERQGTSTQRSSSPPPASPIEGHGRSDSGRDTRSQVYVVHHDGGRAPVTIMTSDGAEVVELPPGYSSVPESSRQRAGDSYGRSGKGALGR
ncbi:Poly A polymerase head domain, partial [Rhizoctonia solani]